MSSAAGSAAGQCTTACPAGATTEVDGCGDENPDPNGGCPSGPGKFQPLGTVSPQSLGIACGTVGQSRNGTLDRDAFAFHLAVPSKVRFDLLHQDPSGAPVEWLSVAVHEGVDCATQVLRYLTLVSQCPVTSDPVSLPAGHHVVTIGVVGAPPPACPVDYQLIVSVVLEVPAECGAADQSCCLSHAGGGCRDLECCSEICSIQSACCETAWDDFCVFAALDICGLCDCNANAVLDSIEIAIGLSADCDLDGVPDECAADCNGNGIADACDILDNPPLDGDGDGFIDGCGCGCLDLVLVVDVTGSMLGAIASVKSGLAQVLESALSAAKGDLRAGLITFTDEVRVVHTLTTDIGAVAASVLALSTSSGAAQPEASDEALRTAITGNSGCLAPGSTLFHAPLRPGCRNLVALVTDAPPGGCDDIFEPGVDDVAAALLAQEAAAQGIEIAAVYVPTFGVNSTTLLVMQNYASTTGGLLGVTGANGAGTADALLSAVVACARQRCIGDLDGDGQVDGADLGILLGGWSDGEGSQAGPSASDLDGNGLVDGADLGILLGIWGSCAGK